MTIKLVQYHKPSFDGVVALAWEKVQFLNKVDTSIKEKLPFSEGLVNAKLVEDLVALGITYETSIQTIELFEKMYCTIDSPDTVKSIIGTLFQQRDN